MRALRFYGADEPLRLEHVPYPIPAAGEAVVRVAACGTPTRAAMSCRLVPW